MNSSLDRYNTLVGWAILGCVAAAILGVVGVLSVSGTRADVKIAGPRGKVAFSLLRRCVLCRDDIISSPGEGRTAAYGKNRSIDQKV